MIIKQTLVDKIEITRTGSIQIRIALELVEDGNVLNTRLHRTAIEPGGDVDAQMAAVNEHLAQMGEVPVSVQDIDRIKKYRSV